MCYLCVNQYTPVGGWTEPDRPPSYRYCNCLINAHGYRHRRVPSVGWLMVPYLRRHLTHRSTGTIHYGLLGIILEWCALPLFLPTLFIECQVAYASSIVTDDDSTSKDAVSKSMLRLGHNPGMCDEAFGEAPGTAG